MAAHPKTRGAENRVTPSSQARRRTVTAYAFLAPALAFLAIFFFLPLGQVIYYSFTDFDLYNANWVGGSNYAELFRDPLFWLSVLVIKVASAKAAFG